MRVKPLQQQISAESYASINELTRYLGGYLSGERDVQIRTSPQGFYACKVEEGEKTIFLPDWRTYDIPLSGVDKWRIYRNGEWHETQHLKYTPKDLWQYSKFDPTKRDIANIIEDRRIEDLGIQYHRGYIPEKIYANAVGFAMRPSVSDLWHKGEEEQAKGNTYAADHYYAQAHREAYLQKLIVKNQKGTLPQDQQALVDEVTVHTEETLRDFNKKHPNLDRDMHCYEILDMLDKESNFVTEKLNLRNRQPPRNAEEDDWQNTYTSSQAEKQRRENKQTPQRQQQQVKDDMEKHFRDMKDKAEKKGRKSRSDAESGKMVCPHCGKEMFQTLTCPHCGYKLEMEKKAGKGEVKPSMEDEAEFYVDDVDKAREGSKHVVEEFKNIQSGRGFELPEGLSTEWMPVADVKPTSPYSDPKFSNEMRLRMKDWRTGRKMEIEKTGQLVNVPAYVSTHGEKSFSRLTRKTVKGEKYLFVLDFSGSMMGRQNEYKKAVINSLETLDGVGAKVAVFSFASTEDPEKALAGKVSGPDFRRSQGFYRVKTFEQGKWKPSDSGRVASLYAGYECTPTARTYAELETYVKKHKPDIMVTITDGVPDEFARTAEQVQKLKRHTRMVAYGIATKADDKYRQNNPSDAEKYDREKMEIMNQDLQGLGYHRHFVVNDVRDIPRRLVDLIAPKTA